MIEALGDVQQLLLLLLVDIEKQAGIVELIIFGNFDHSWRVDILP